MEFPTTRMRRLRKNAKIRDIVRETKLQKEDLIYPIYFKEELEGMEISKIICIVCFRFVINALFIFKKRQYIISFFMVNIILF